MARQPEVEISVREATGDGCSADPCLGTSPAKAHIWLYPIATPSLNKYNAIYSLTGHLISRSAFLVHAASIGAPFDKLVVGVANADPHRAPMYIPGSMSFLEGQLQFLLYISICALINC